MTVNNDFDSMLDDVLHDMANAPAPERLAERTSARLQMVAQRELAGAAMAASLGPMFGAASRETGVLVSIWESLRERVWAKRLPPLALKSRPIAVVDRMAVQGGTGARIWAVALHAMAILLIGVIVRAQVRLAAPVRPQELTELTVPPKALPQSTAIGGGGGQHGPEPATQGTPPKFAEQQIVPPKVPPMIEAKIRMEPVIEVQQDIKMASSLPQIGVADSPLVGASMGNGSGTGLGSGDGAGIGPGSGGNMGGGLRQIGGGISAPVLIYKVDPMFSEEARKAKVSGSVLVNLWVDENGLPGHVHVVQGIGMGLNEKAIEAVKQYRFKPAMENGRPVTVELNVEVIFQILVG